jgi:membrane protein required for colicin V production
MTYAVDVAVVGFVLLAALRGWWRGFFREFFGLLGLAVGLYAASEYAPLLSPWLAEKVTGPETVRDGLAYVAVFVAANLATNILGLVLDRVAAALLLGGVNRAAGAVFGAGKATAVAAVVLLFVHLFPPLSTLDEQVMASPLGRSLVETAGNVLRVSLPAQAATASTAPPLARPPAPPAEPK